MDDVQPICSRAYRDVSGTVRIGESRKGDQIHQENSVPRNPHAGHLEQPIPRRWKRLHVHGISFGEGGAKRWRQASVLRELSFLGSGCTVPCLQIRARTNSVHVG